MNRDQLFNSILPLLEPFELSECNGYYQVLACQRLHGMAEILGIPAGQLTLAQAAECIKKAEEEFNALSLEEQKLVQSINARLSAA